MISITPTQLILETSLKRKKIKKILKRAWYFAKRRRAKYIARIRSFKSRKTASKLKKYLYSQWKSLDLAPPGIRNIYYLEPSRSKTVKNPKLYSATDRTYRKYSISAFLEKHPSTNEEMQICFNPFLDDGSSFLEVNTEKGKQLTINHRGYIFDITKNKSNEISAIRGVVSAKSDSEARSKFHGLLIPLLDKVSFEADVPINLSRMISFDIENNTTSVEYTLPYGKATFPERTWNPAKELHEVYALYRESLSATSIYYKFLCYYTLIDGMKKIINPSIYALARKYNLSISMESKFRPNKELAEAHNIEAGSKIFEYFDKTIQTEDRNAIAHFSLKVTGSVLNYSDYDTYAKYSRQIYPLNQCSRILIEEAEEALIVLKNGNSCFSSDWKKVIDSKIGADDTSKSKGA